MAINKQNIQNRYWLTRVLRLFNMLESNRDSAFYCCSGKDHLWFLAVPKKLVILLLSTVLALKDLWIFLSYSIYIKENAFFNCSGFSIEFSIPEILSVIHSNEVSKRYFFGSWSDKMRSINWDTTWNNHRFWKIL